MASAISRQAFERLVLEQHAAVYRAARRIVGPEDARDVTQQVFLAVLEGRLRPGEAEDVARLLRWKAVREALSLLRAGKSRKSREEARAMHEESGVDAVEAREEQLVVRRELEALPDGLRAVVVLRYVEGWSLAEIGEALRVSTTTAHERLGKALSTLKRALTRAGFAVAAASVESRLADAAAPVDVPRGLAGELLTLEAGAGAGAAAALGGASLSAKLLSMACALVVVASMVAGAVGVQRGAVPAGTRVVAVPEPARGPEVLSEPATSGLVARHAVDPQDPLPLPPVPPAAGPVERTGTLSGLVVDGDGLPLEGVLVHAWSVERKDKRARSSVEGATGRDGRYRLQVPVLAEEGDAYHVSVLTLGFAEWTSPVLSVRADRETRAPEARLPAGGGEQPGKWRLEVQVTDARGQPVEGALVRVLRRRERGEGRPDLTRHEAGGRTDAQGLGRIEGEILGKKQLWIDAREAGLREWKEPLDLLVADATSVRHVRLEPGLEIRGTLRTLDGAPLGELQVWAMDDPAQWRMGVIESDGRFAIRGLEPQAYELRVRGNDMRWSPVHRKVEAGSELALVLKRRDDPRDVGDHAGELHGVCTDRATGKPRMLDDDAVEVRRLDADLPSDEAAVLMLAPLMAQRMRMGAPPPPSASFHVTGLEPGTYMVLARAKDCAPAMAGPFELGESTLVAGIALQLGPGAELKGQVVDLDGTPLKGAHVVVLGFGEGSQARLAEWDAELQASRGRGVHIIPSFKTGADGSFRGGRIPAGMRVRVAALYPERRPAQVDLAAADDGGVLEARVRFGR